MILQDGKNNKKLINRSEDEKQRKEKRASNDGIAGKVNKFN